jgi:hypothetical protein
VKELGASIRLNRREVLKGATALGALSSLQVLSEDETPLPNSNHRQYWIKNLTRIAEPVLSALSKRQLKLTMPVEAPYGNAAERAQFTHLEAFGRLMAGIAPWLESGSRWGPEGQLRARYADLARQCLDAATDPGSPDFMNFNKGNQPVVDTAFLTLGILRAPGELWDKLSKTTQENLVRALQSSRVIKPGFNNWLLFSATVEAGLSRMGVWWDPMRVDYAVRSIESFYKGDGTYGDGPSFHWDYYNSFVIHPMLVNVLETISKVSSDWKSFTPQVTERAQRFAEIQERMISPEGTFPAIGRSLSYRFGAFHHLADTSLRQSLPKNLEPAQVRCALTAVMRRTMNAPGTFDDHGWLRIGFCGHQPEIAESYISTGSTYLCSVVLLPLGLDENNQFWAAPPAQWTSQKAWSGADIASDHAINV